MVHLSNAFYLSLLSSASASSSEPSAHIIIDMQDCFMEQCGTPPPKPKEGEEVDPEAEEAAKRRYKPAGSLQVANSNSIINNIRAFRAWGKDTGFIAHTVWSKDAHPEDHISFASRFGKKPFADSVDLVCNLGPFGHKGADAMESPKCCPLEGTDEKLCECELNTDKSVKDPKQCRLITQALWPNHCVPGKDNDITDLLNPDLDNDTFVEKGTEKDVDSYSAFFANLDLTEDEIAAAKGKKDSDAMLPTFKILQEKGIKHLYFSGLATDYCVKFSALHARDLGFEVTLLKDTVKGVFLPAKDAAKLEKAVMKELTDAGVTLSTTEEVVAGSGVEGKTLKKFEDPWTVDQCNHGARVSMTYALAWVTMLLV